MADDLDDLLKEAEDALYRQTQAKSTQPLTKATIKTVEDDEIDKMINDICNDDDPEPIHKPWTKPSSPVASKSSQSKRCSTLILGGSKTGMGLYDQNPSACDKIRCTSCDFPVMWFNDNVWHSKCDYLFFRNNMPNPDKLKKNLVRKRGSRAYACQCSWESVDRIVEVSTLSKLKWVCGKH